MLANILILLSCFTGGIFVVLIWPFIVGKVVGKSRKIGISEEQYKDLLEKIDTECGPFKSMNKKTERPTKRDENGNSLADIMTKESNDIEPIVKKLYNKIKKEIKEVAKDDKHYSIYILLKRATPDSINKKLREKIELDGFEYKGGGGKSKLNGKLYFKINWGENIGQENMGNDWRLYITI